MQALFSGVWGFSSVVGPVVGGFITDQISWRWVFFINIPVGIVAATIIGFALKEPKQKQKPTIDYAGAILLMLAISLLMLAMVEGVKSLATIIAPANVALFAYIIRVALAVRAGRAASKGPDNSISASQEPDGFGVDTCRFSRRNRDVRSDIVRSAVCSGCSRNVRDRGRFDSYATDVELGHDVGHRRSAIAQVLVSSADYHWICTLLTIGFTLMAMYGTQTPRFWLYAELVIIGMGLGFTMLTLLIAVQQAVERRQLGVATSLNQFSRAIGGAFGVAVMGVALTIGLGYQLHKMADQPGSSVLA